MRKYTPAMFWKSRKLVVRPGFGSTKTGQPLPFVTTVPPLSESVFNPKHREVKGTKGTCRLMGGYKRNSKSSKYYGDKLQLHSYTLTYSTP